MRADLKYSLILALLAAIPSYAAPIGQVSAGMNPNEIIQALGVPTSKIERESAREEIWVYPAGEAKFKEGRLVFWQPKEVEPVMVSAEPPAPADGAIADKNARTESAEVSEILSELMKVGSGDAPATTGAPSHNLPNLQPKRFQQP